MGQSSNVGDVQGVSRVIAGGVRRVIAGGVRRVSGRQGVSRVSGCQGVRVAGFEKA